MVSRLKYYIAATKDILTTTLIITTVELKWSKLPKDLFEVSLNKELSVECDAIGVPQPTIEWSKLSINSNERNHLNSNGRSGISILISSLKIFFLISMALFRYLNCSEG